MTGTYSIRLNFLYLSFMDARLKMVVFLLPGLFTKMVFDDSELKSGK